MVAELLLQRLLRGVLEEEHTGIHTPTGGNRGSARSSRNWSGVVSVTDCFQSYEYRINAATAFYTSFFVLKIVICSLIKLVDIVQCVDLAAECILCVEGWKERERDNRPPTVTILSLLNCLSPESANIL